MFIYPETSKNLNHRALFINDISRLILRNNSNNLWVSAEEIGRYKKEHFEDNIRNYYELVDSETPLLGLYDLLTNGADNYDFTEEEYQEAIARTKEAITRLLIEA